MWTEDISATAAPAVPAAPGSALAPGSSLCTAGSASSATALASNRAARLPACFPRSHFQVKLEFAGSFLTGPLATLPWASSHSLLGPQGFKARCGPVFFTATPERGCFEPLFREEEWRLREARALPRATWEVVSETYLQVHLSWVSPTLRSWTKSSQV